MSKIPKRKRKINQVQLFFVIYMQNKHIKIYMIFRAFSLQNVELIENCERFF